MSFIYRDLQAVPTALLYNFSNLYGRFDGSKSHSDNGFYPGAWKTHYKYDLATNKYIEVYDSKLKYFRDGFVHDESIKRFVKALGMNWDEFTDDSGQDLNAVDDMWFYFKGGFQWDGTVRFNGTYSTKDWNHNNNYAPTKGLDKPTRDQIANEINNVFEVGDTIEIEVSYGGGLKRYISTHELSWVATGVEVVSDGFNAYEVRSKLLSEPWYYLANSRHKPYKYDNYQAQTYNSGRNNELATEIKRPSNRRIPVADVALKVDNKDGSDESSRKNHSNYLIGLMAFMGDGNEFVPFDYGQGVYYTNPKVSTVNTNYMDRGAMEEACPDNQVPTHLLNCDGEILEYRFTVKFTYEKKVTASSKVVNEIYDWIQDFYEDTTKIPAEIDSDTNIHNYNDKLVTSTVDTDFKKAMYRLIEDTQPSSFYETTNSLYYGGHLRVDAVSNMKRKDFARLVATKLSTDYSLDQPHGWAKLRSKIILVVVIIIAIYVSIQSGGTAAKAGATMIEIAAVALGSAAITLSIGLLIGGLTGLMNKTDMKILGRVSMVVGIAAMVTGIYAAYQKASEQLTEEMAKEVGQESAKPAFSDVAVQMVKNAFTGPDSNVMGKVKMATDQVTKTLNEDTMSKIEDIKQETEVVKDKNSVLEFEENIRKMTADVNLTRDLPFADSSVDMLTIVDKLKMDAAEKHHGEREALMS